MAKGLCVYYHNGIQMYSGCMFGLLVALDDPRLLLSLVPHSLLFLPCLPRFLCSRVVGEVEDLQDTLSPFSGNLLTSDYRLP